MATEKPSLEIIFRAAIQIASDEERAAYISQACGDDLELRGLVEKLSRDHLCPDPLASMNDLPVSEVFAGRTEDALKRYEETLQLQKAKLGPDHPDTLMCMGKLADWYLAMGRTQQAIKLDQEMLQLQKAKLGPDHPDTLARMIGLARCYAGAGRTSEALKLREETLHLAKAKLGAEHPATLTSMSDLAESYADAGRIQEALKLREETLHLAKAKLGADHPAVLMSMNNLAKSYADAGRIQEALELFEERLQLQQDKLGPDHPDTLSSMKDLAKSYADAGRTQEALELLEERVELIKEDLGPDAPNTLSSMKDLAKSYADAGRSQEALRLREQTLQLQQDKLGLDHPETLGSMNDFANAYIAEGQVDKAAAILQKTLALRERRVMAEPGNTVEQAFLAWTHGQMGEAERVRLDYAAAVQGYGTSVEMLEKLDNAGALKDPVFQGSLKVCRQRLALCRQAEQAVKDLNFALGHPGREALLLLDLRVRFLLKQHQLATAVESAAKIMELAGDKPEPLYAAACEYALCAGAAKQATSPVAGAPGSEKLAEEALALLKRAVANGFKNAAHMKKDKDLDALRAREDFKKLLAKLEAAKRD
jgi:tetratricopeptide (TPR) repeat protein